jgi:hypothetical protein
MPEGPRQWHSQWLGLRQPSPKGACTTTRAIISKTETRYGHTARLPAITCLSKSGSFRF